MIKRFLLPDYNKKTKGYILEEGNTEINDDASIVNIANEAFQVPEVIFTPSDIGISEGGLADMVKQISSQRVPSSFENLILSNIIIGGGSTKFRGFKDRLKHEIENEGRLTDQIRKVNIFEAEKQDHDNNNIDSAWRGLKLFSTSPTFPKYTVSKEEWQE